jgi:hypothetical protein
MPPVPFGLVVPLLPHPGDGRCRRLRQPLHPAVVSAMSSSAASIFAGVTLFKARAQYSRSMLASSSRSFSRLTFASSSSLMMMVRSITPTCAPQPQGHAAMLSAS